MAGFEKEFVLGEASWRQRFARDRRLAAHMLRVLWMWATLVESGPAPSASPDKQAQADSKLGQLFS